MKKNSQLLISIIIIIIISSCEKDKEVPIDSIKIKEKTLLINVNDSKRITVTINPSDYNMNQITWQSSNRSVATINDSGFLKAVHPGTSEILISSKNGKVADTCFVTVVNIKNYKISDGLLSNSVGTVSIDKIGNIWFGTSNGLSKFDGSKWSSYTVSDGLASNSVNCIQNDNNGNIWVGTNAGASKFDGINWTTFNTKDGLVNNEVYAIAFDNKGCTWFGTSNGLSKFDGKKWETFTTNNGLLGYYNLVFDIEFDKVENKIWAVTHAAVSIFNGISWSGYYNDAHISSTIYGLSIDKYNNKWLATIDGISKFDGTNWINPITDSNYLLIFAHEILFDNENNVWFKTRDGIFKFNGKYVSAFEGDNKELLSKTEIREICIDNDENIWVAKTFEGVFKIETK